MDLIYADKKRKDIGVIEAYAYDLAYGKDENDYKLTLMLKNHCLQERYSVYIENTEYGGIVDSITVNTENKTVTYSGRTWHGMLSSKVLQPDKGNDYLVVDGEANSILAHLIKIMHLEDWFEASTEDSGIEINQYQFERYIYGYNGIRKMLESVEAKLIIKYRNKKVVLSAEPAYNYANDEEWDSSQLDFTVEKNYNQANHLICLGQGNLKDRYVIHLFTDAHGGIIPYSNGNPVKDSDYILDEHMKYMINGDEIIEVLDYPNAEFKENYEKVLEKPDNWSSVFNKYYKQVVDNGNVSYKSLESTTEEVVQSRLLDTQPSDWQENYAKYSIKNQSGGYDNVEGIINTKYTQISAKPSDWAKNYGNYYYYWSDGTKYEYKNVNSVSYYVYNIQTMKPSDWAKNYKNYYYKSKGKYVSVTRTKKNKVPTWVSKKYYTKDTKYKAPNFEKTIKSGTKYYIRADSVVAPPFELNKYYIVVTSIVNIVPSWIDNYYYELHIDHYANLVESGVERLKEIWNSDKISSKLDPEQQYDIGDIVGANENTTGISVWQPITKKIVKIENGKIQTRYEIGE